MQNHDPSRQLSFIQQALSQNRKPIGFFIGAGCPLSVRVKGEKDGVPFDNPLIWDVEGLTKIIDEKIKEAGGEVATSWEKLTGVIKQDGGDERNIEHVLSKIRAFIGVAGKGEVRGMTAKEMAALDEKICEIILVVVDKSLPDEQTPYHNLAVWARAIPREKPVHLFTTNYDLLLEQALEESSAPYFDGFIGARKAFFDLGAVEDERLLPARWTRLWKIHGSLNWQLEGKNNVIRSDDRSVKRSYLIYPSHLKYDQSRKMPYLAMLDRLKAFLLDSSAILFICGYSFGDEHINDVICRSLETNPTSQVFAFVYGSLDQDKYAQGRMWAQKTPNLSLLGFDKAIIGRKVATWHAEDIESLSAPANVLIKSGDDIHLQLGDFAALGNLLLSLGGTLEKSNADQQQ